jgi:DNA processing protein
MRVATIPFRSPEYPARLRDLAEPPQELWAIGDRAMLDDPIVAIVGTRRATAYGLRITRELSAALARAGACIVSGMALGIDAAAHRAALEAGGRTIAVLGSGVDVPTPKSHTPLYHEIADRGLLLSEMPLGAHAHMGSFLKRNRIIAALAQVIFVVEAPADSGALNTVMHGMAAGRDIGVVLGNIDSPQSLGSNLLVRDGAHPIVEIDDALALAGLTPHARGASRRAPDDPMELRVWSALADGDATMDELCARTALPVAECMVAVTGLEMRGAVECALTGVVRRR